MIDKINSSAVTIVNYVTPDVTGSHSLGNHGIFSTHPGRDFSLYTTQCTGIFGVGSARGNHGIFSTHPGRDFSLYTTQCTGIFGVGSARLYRTVGKSSREDSWLSVMLDVWVQDWHCIGIKLHGPWHAYKLAIDRSVLAPGDVSRMMRRPGTGSPALAGPLVAFPALMQGIVQCSGTSGTFSQRSMNYECKNKRGRPATVD
ncbi:hypothetical protein EGW08_000126 [Elysia chlorotica]|uniref:Uncharacterized protein n=1 Tax=Elysia chlorotica TaxID=188477 RepID=A0A3S1I4N8_ELYCH|nr:hypothetical protein EGW08_000126 [Elysia chlorotica]